MNDNIKNQIIIPMNGVTILETEALERLISKIGNLEVIVQQAMNDLKESKKPYLNVAEVMELTGFGKGWVNNNKEKIGFCSVDGSIRFKRTDVQNYMTSKYFKAK